MAMAGRSSPISGATDRRKIPPMPRFRAPTKPIAVSDRRVDSACRTVEPRPPAPRSSSYPAASFDPANATGGYRGFPRFRFRPDWRSKPTGREDKETVRGSSGDAPAPCLYRPMDSAFLKTAGLNARSPSCYSRAVRLIFSFPATISGWRRRLF